MHIRLVRILAFLGAVLWALLTQPADAQQLPTQRPAALAPQAVIPLSLDPSRNPATTLGETLRSLAGRSGTVFLGSVQQIDRQPTVVTITLSVLEPILGDPGPTYTLREWAGLWPLGRQRYTVGQRALFFLHPPAASGLSTPVDGQFGVIPLLPTSADAAPLLDTRWLNARLQRPGAAPLAEDALSLADAKLVVAQWNSPTPIAEPTHYALPVSLRLAPGAAR